MPGSRRSLFRHTAALALLGTVAACTLVGVRPQVAPTRVPPERIDRLVRELNDEWVRWGSAVVRLDVVPGATCLSQADGGCVNVDVGCGPEQAATLCPVVNGYWLSVGHPPRNACEHTDVCTTTRPPGVAYHANAPWSAAFVSAMMERAGFSPTEFAREANHAAYIAAARDGTASAYDVVPTPATVLPGDLLCAGRADAALQPEDLHRIRAAGFAMHCDVVVHVDAAARRAEVIGGNVQQTVAKAVVPLDDQGRVSFDAAAARAWAFVMKARRTLPSTPPDAP